MLTDLDHRWRSDARVAKSMPQCIGRAAQRRRRPPPQRRQFNLTGYRSRLEQRQEELTRAIARSPCSTAICPSSIARSPTCTKRSRPTRPRMEKMCALIADAGGRQAARGSYRCARQHLERGPEDQRPRTEDEASAEQIKMVAGARNHRELTLPVSVCNNGPKPPAPSII